MGCSVPGFPVLHHLPEFARTHVHMVLGPAFYVSHNASPVAQTVKNPPAMLETWVRSPGWEDPLEKGKVTHSSILAWKIPWTKKPGGLQSLGVTKSQTQLND